jgi:hypothetical protein
MGLQNIGIHVVTQSLYRKEQDMNPQTWTSSGEDLVSLISLVMNIHCFLFFPLFLYKWRGAGLVVYLLLLFLAGLPILYMEILVGLYLPFRYCVFVCRPKVCAQKFL